MITYTAGNNPRRSCGFTLIELLVVIGLIALLAAGIGMSMRDGNPSSALRTAQSSLVSSLSSARGQAALTQSDSMLVVDITDLAQDECLRSVQVVVRAGPAPLDQWRAVGSPINLPQGIYIVPPNGTTVGGLTFEGAWSANRKSMGFQTPVGGLTERPYDAVNYPYQPSGAFTGRTYLKFQYFNPLGTTSNAGTILVTSGQKTGPNTVVLNNPEMLRGVYVSRYGVPALINEAATFDNVTIP